MINRATCLSVLVPEYIRSLHAPKPTTQGEEAQQDDFELVNEDASDQSSDSDPENNFQYPSGLIVQQEKLHSMQIE